MHSTLVYISPEELRNVIRTEITQIIREELKQLNIKTPTDIEEIYLDIRGASSFLKLSTHTLRKKAQKRELTCIKKNGKWLFEKAALHQYLDLGKQKSIQEIRTEARKTIKEKIKL